MRCDSQEVTGESDDTDDDRREWVKRWVTLGESVDSLGRLLDVSRC